MKEAGLADDFEHVESPGHADKVRFLHGIDVLSVPTTYREPKGLYVLEALANSVPVVQPRHGSFPELIEATGGGLLVNPERRAQSGGRLAADDGRSGPCATPWAARARRPCSHASHADRMAEETAAVYAQYVR